MIIKAFKDIRSAWEGAYLGMLEDRPGAIDYYQRNIIHSHDNHLVARSGIFDYDLGEVGLTPTKWSKFTGQYVDVEKLHAWVDNAMNVKTYESLYQFKDVPPNFTGRKAVHQWGKCLLGLSFRRLPKPPTVTFYTRAQSLGFSGIADYALLDFVTRKLSERMGLEQSAIRVQIYCPNFIIKMVETVHFLYGLGRLEEFLNADTRIGDSIRYYYKYINQDEEAIKWRAARRMKHKFEKFQRGEFRSLPVKDLTIKGWEAEKRINKGSKRTSREASELVLVGKGRRGPTTLEMDLEAAV